jgi:GNAT superfamily N-acetyltransferase
MQWRPLTGSDLPTVGRWNRELQEDEGSQPMPLEAIEARLAKWLAGEYTGTVFSEDGIEVGYALFRPTDPELKGPGGIYVRQFFIVRDQRGAGTGRRAFELLAREVLPAGHRIVLEALASNPGGQRFWRSLGFAEYAVTFQLEAPR